MGLHDEPTPPPITSKRVPLTPEQTKLANDNYGLVVKAVNVWLRCAAGRALGRDELLSVASHAFTACIPQFDPAVAKLSTFATTKINYAILEACRGAWKHGAIGEVLRAVAAEEAPLHHADLSNPLESDDETRKRFGYITSGLLQANFVALLEASNPTHRRPELAEDEVLDAIQTARARAAIDRVAASSPVHAAVRETCFERGGYELLAARLGVSSATAYRYKQAFLDAVCAELGLERSRSAA